MDNNMTDGHVSIIYFFLLLHRAFRSMSIDPSARNRAAAVDKEKESEREKERESGKATAKKIYTKHI